MSPNNVPPPLAPSVEEAYRRKCLQLKQRTLEVEENNDAVRVRLARLKRQIEKIRLERAFLLEQLSKRTSANVEDSDGSPSPPPTPQEKPLRIKRGHRKQSLLANLETTAAPGATFINQGVQNLSPSSDAFSHENRDRPKPSNDEGATNGADNETKREEPEGEAEPDREAEPEAEPEKEASAKDQPQSQADDTPAQDDDVEMTQDEPDAKAGDSPKQT